MSNKEGFFKRNGKKFVIVLVGGICVTYMAVTETIDPFYAVLYWFGAGGVSAGAITR